MLLCRINRASKFSESMTRVQHVKAWLRRSLILLPVLGITWSFGLLTFISSTIVFHYLFTIFNSLQGFVIFFNFCVLDSEVGFLVILATTVNLDCKIVGFSLEINSSSSSRRGVHETPEFQPLGLVFPKSRHSLFLISPRSRRWPVQKHLLLCSLLLQCGYYNLGHLGKVDQSDYRKITLHSEKVLVVNHNYHETKSTTWIEINSPTWPFEPVEEILCFLRGPLEWMTEKINVNVSYIFYLGSQVSAKRSNGSKETAGRWQNNSLF